MALSPAVNDPHTAVEVVERLRILLPRLAEFDHGPYGFEDERSVLRVIINDEGFGSYVKAATEQILLYGAGDPAVLNSLERLTADLERLGLGARDLEAVGELREKVDRHRAAYASS